jgi:hypothetical protein
MLQGQSWCKQPCDRSPNFRAVPNCGDFQMKKPKLCGRLSVFWILVRCALLSCEKQFTRETANGIENRVLTSHHRRESRLI